MKYLFWDVSHLYHRILMTKNEEKIFVENQSCHQVCPLRVGALHIVVFVDLKYCCVDDCCMLCYSVLCAKRGNDTFTGRAWVSAVSVSCRICFVTPRNIVLTAMSLAIQKLKTIENFANLEHSKNHKNLTQLHLFTQLLYEFDIIFKLMKEPLKHSLFAKYE